MPFPDRCVSTATPDTPLTQDVTAKRRQKGRLPPDHVQAIRRLAAAGTRKVDIARQFGVSPSTVAAIVTRNSYVWVP